MGEDCGGEERPNFVVEEEELGRVTVGSEGIESVVDREG